MSILVVASVQLVRCDKAWLIACLYLMIVASFELNVVDLYTFDAIAFFYANEAAIGNCRMPGSDRAPLVFFPYCRLQRHFVPSNFNCFHRWNQMQTSSLLLNSENE